MSAETARDRRRAWVSSYLADARPRGTWPTYGSLEWHDLAPGDPLRWAAVIVAAECWADEGEMAPARLAAEIDAGRELQRQDDLWRSRVAADVAQRANRPDYAQLQWRRGEITEQQLAQYRVDMTAFVSGRTNTRPPLPRPAAQQADA